MEVFKAKRQKEIFSPLRKSGVDTGRLDWWGQGRKSCDANHLFGKVGFNSNNVFRIGFNPNHLFGIGFNSNYLFNLIFIQPALKLTFYTNKTMMSE